MGSHPDYIRVGAMVTDTESVLTDMYALAFTSAQDDESVKTVVNGGVGTKFALFNPVNGKRTTTSLGETLNVIAYITSTTDGVPIDSSSGTYFPYIYTKNSSGFEKVTMASVQAGE